MVVRRWAEGWPLFVCLSELVCNRRGPQHFLEGTRRLPCADGHARAVSPEKGVTLDVGKMVRVARDKPPDLRGHRHRHVRS